MTLLPGNTKGHHGHPYHMIPPRTPPKAIRRKRIGGRVEEMGWMKPDRYPRKSPRTTKPRPVPIAAERHLEEIAYEATGSATGST